MLILRWLGLLFLVLGGAMLAVGFGGFADDWIAANVSCGDEYDSHACAPGEAQLVLKLVGGIFVGIALIELAVSVVWSRTARFGRRVGFQSWTATQAPEPAPASFLPHVPAPAPRRAAGTRWSTASRGWPTCATAAS